MSNMKPRATTMNQTYPTFTAPQYATGGGGDFEPCPAGVYPAILYRIVDLGTQKESFEGKESARRKVLLSFEISDPETAMQDTGKPFTIHRRFTLSMHPQGALRPFISAWRGKVLTDGEAANFDLSILMEKPALLNITHAERAGKTRADIATIMPLPKGYVSAKLQNPPVLFQAERPDLDTLHALGKGLQATIEASPEFQRAMRSSPPSYPPKPGDTEPPGQPSAPAYPPRPVAAYPERPAIAKQSSPPPMPLPPVEAYADEFEDDIPF
jgi:hypothetical protein